MIVNDYKDAKQNYNKDHASFLPRMWSPEHTENYLDYTGFLNYKIRNFKYFFDNYNDPQKLYESVKKSISEAEKKIETRELCGGNNVELEKCFQKGAFTYINRR